METVFEIRPHRGGWQCFEGPGVEPYWTGPSAKESALSYARGRAAMRKGAIHVYNPAGELVQTIPFDQQGRKITDA